MSSEIAGNREDQEIDESNSEFECLQQDLQINRDDLKVFVKMDLPTKYKMINKLNEFNQTLFYMSLSNEKKVAFLKENNEIISTLDNLPVLVDNKATNYFVDWETNDSQSNVLDGGRFENID